MARAKKEAENLTVNIKSMPIKAHAGASKYINDDWGTVAFFIPRNSLGLQFADIELQYNCIYFLVGFRDLEWLAYVGQAKKRNSGGSVLRRLREHSDSATEKYRSDWDWVIVVTNKDDAWGLDDLNALENAFYHEIPTKKNLNGNTPNSAGADFNSYLDKIKQIKAYIAILGFDIFEQTENIDKVQVTSVTNEYTIVEDLQNGMARIPEIVTPQRVVKDMVDMLEKENPDIWSPDKTFLDPACKGGEYLYEIYTRLMESETMKVKFPSDIARAVHILQNQVYGIALSQVSLDRTVNKLNGFGQNIKIIPNYISILKSKDLGTKADGKAITFKDKISEVFGKDMKFDVVIGNPPYQKDSERGTQGGMSIYSHFMDLYKHIGCRYSAMIVPARWLCNAGSRGIDEAWVKEELSCNHYREIHIEENSRKIFPGVEIKGGVMYYIKDKEYNGKCLVNGQSRFLDDAEIGKFVSNEIEADIIKKIHKVAPKYMNSVVSSYSPFGIQSNAICVSIGNILLHRARGESEHIGIEDINKGFELLKLFKVMAPLSYGDGHKGERLTNIKITGPNEACTSSYVVVAPSSKEADVLNTAKYMKTRLFNLTIGIVKVTQSASKEVYQFVPLQDFTSNSDIDWSKSIAEIDQQLYKKYGLSAEEIDYIEKTIKPME